MPKITKEYKVINCKLDKEIADMLEEFSKKTGITKTAAIEKALKKYIDEYNKTGKLQ